MSAAAREGRLFPEFGGLVAPRSDKFVLINGDGRRSVIDGPICQDIAESLAQAAPTPGLQRLAGAHAALGELARWLTTRSVPLTRLDAVRLDGFDTLFLELLGQCNERCVHCYADSAPTVTDALDRATVMSVIEQAAELGFRRIQLTGGDPLLCDFLPEAVAHARACGISQIEIYTNGLALGDALLDRLAPHAPSFAFSMYSLDPDEHDRMTRTPGSQRRTLAAIDRVVARKLPLRVSIIMIEQRGDLQALIDHLHARGVASVAWTRTFSVGRGVEHAEASRALDITVETSDGGAHRGDHPASDSAEPARHGKLCVTYAGDVVPCIFQRQARLGNVRDGRLIDLLSTSDPAPRRGLPIAEEARQRLQCASCRLTEIGLGLVGGAA